MDIDFLFDHDFSYPIEEKFSYLTDIIENFYGDEQRIALRKEPRRYLTYTYTLTSAELRLAKNKLKLAPGGQLYIPDFLRKSEAVNTFNTSTPLTLTIAEGSFFDPTGRLLVNGNLRQLFYQFNYNNPVYFFAAGSRQVNITQTITLSKPSDPIICTPIIKVSIEGEPTVTHLTSTIATMTVTFSVDHGYYFPLAYQNATFPTYKDNIIFPFSANRVTNITEQHLTISDIFDAGTGVIERRNRFAYRIFQGQFDLGKNETDTMKKFMHATRGLQKNFFFDLENSDIELKTAITAGQNYITVADCGFRYLETDTKFITIQTTLGPILREVSSIETAAAGQEKINLTEVFDANIDLSSVNRIAFLECVRFGSDDFVFKYLTDSHASITKNFKTVRYSNQQ